MWSRVIDYLQKQLRWNRRIHGLICSKISKGSLEILGGCNYSTTIKCDKISCKQKFKDWQLLYYKIIFAFQSIEDLLRSKVLKEALLLLLEESWVKKEQKMFAKLNCSKLNRKSSKAFIDLFWQNIDFIGLVSSFLAARYPKSFGLGIKLNW